MGNVYGSAQSMKRFGGVALAAFVLASCIGDGGGAKRPTENVYTSPVGARPPVGNSAVHTPVRNEGPDQQLRDDLYEIWRTFPGKTGIAVRRIDSGNWDLSYRGDELFPQQSVSKLWVALTVLDQVDQGRLSLNKPVEIDYDDLAVFYSPTRDAYVASGKPLTRTIDELLQMAITHSDNTANDVLLWQAGGPDAVRKFIADRNLGAIRFGPGERLLQSRIAGLEWRQELAIGNRFFDERAKLSYDSRSRALNAYLADPYDGAQPEAITHALDRLARGELLSAASTAYILGTLERTRSGPNRLKGGLPAGWQFLHKTGTGQQLGGTQTGFNDIGIMTAPDATRYAVVVMLSDTTAGGADRMAMMRKVSAAVARYHDRNR